MARSLRSRTAKQQKEKDQEVEKEKMDLTRSRSIKPVHSNKEVKRARGRKKKSVETVSHVTTTSSAVPSVAVEQPPPPAKSGLQSVLVDVKGNTTSLPDKEQTSVVARKEAPGNLAMSSDEGLSDDSDADPMWTPSAGTHKGSESLKSFVTGASLFKKDKKKLFRKNVLSPSSRKRTRKVVDATKTDPVVLNIKEFVSKKVKLMMANADTKPDKKGDSFLLLKADIGKEKPSLWRVDREMNCLQRFDPCEMEGNELHRNTDTYSLWNDALKKDYVRANVRTLVHHRKEYVVQYLDLQTSPESFEDPSSSEMTTTNPLRENFIVFLQTLISQVLDTSFLSEITNENDEYFLRDIREIEKVTDDKKKLLVKNTWDPELRKCADIYPCLNIVAHMRNEYLKCQVCSVTSSQKLLKFYGQPYNWTTLSPNKCPSSIKTQFHVCARCSNIVSLYNRVHHQKYNFFIKCHSKVNQMKSDNEAFENQVLLKHCLEDSSWVNLLFAELESIWKECEENS